MLTSDKELNDVWIVIKRLRIQVASKFSVISKSCGSDVSTGKIPEGAIVGALSDLEGQLGINGPNYSILEDTPEPILETAAEMYLYLLLCPKSVSPWAEFLTSLIQNDSPKEILLTLNRLKIVAMKGNDSFKGIFFNILEKLRHVLNL